MSNEFKAKNGIVLGLSHPVNFISNSSTFVQDQSTLLTAHAITGYIDNNVIKLINTSDSSLSTLTLKYNTTEASLGNLTAIKFDASILILTNRIDTTDSSLLLKQPIGNYLDASSIATSTEILMGVDNTKIASAKNLKDSEFIAIHVGITPPIDTSILWLDIN